MIPPKPKSRPRGLGLWAHFKRFRKDILSAQPEHLFRAWMAEFKTPFFKSYLVNQPELVARILRERPADFPKSKRVTRGLENLLGPHSVFVTNGETWARQRRLLDPAFAHGRAKDSFAPMRDAIQDALSRVPDGAFEAQAFTSHLAADVIFRTLFSVPITDATARATFEAFQRYQARQPIVNAAAFLPFLGRLGARRGRSEALEIRRLITTLVVQRLAQIKAGTAPDDLATRILGARDADTGQGFSQDEMVDQVAIFFLAGHETSASALAWALYLLATNPAEAAQITAELADLPDALAFSDLTGLRHTRNLFRETLRLYPPVPMMVRETACPETFRDRAITPGSQVVISPWHLHRHTRIWNNPDAFCPARFDPASDAHEKEPAARAFIPFSAGQRVCVGASFAMTEGVLSLAMLARAFAFSAQGHETPVPQAQLTLRSANGIWLNAKPRDLRAT